jgi:hypothetical protein
VGAGGDRRADTGRDAAQAQQWRAGGQYAYGYRLGADGKQLEPDPGEQAVLSAIGGLRAKRFTLRAIATELNARGWRTRRASPWRLEDVAHILRPPRKG